MLQQELEELRKKNEILSTKLSKVEAKCTQTTVQETPSKLVAPKKTGLDLHQSKKTELDNMPNDEDPLLSARW